MRVCGLFGQLPTFFYLFSEKMKIYILIYKKKKIKIYRDKSGFLATSIKFTQKHTKFNGEEYIYMSYKDNYESAGLYFPETMKKVIDGKNVSHYDIMFHLNDGDTVLYNSVDTTIRTLPQNDRELTEEECKKEFGIRLLNIMRRNGVTQSELSERTGLSQPRLSNYIAGKVAPTLYTLDKIAKALHCSVDEFRYYWEL